MTAGIQQKWTTLGATTIYGEYGRYNKGAFAVLDEAGDPEEVYTGSHVNMWSIGINQAIDAFKAPASHSFAFKGLWRCNWLQAFEVGIDPAHPSFLHRYLQDERGGNSAVYFAQVNAMGQKNGGDVRVTNGTGESSFTTALWNGTQFAFAWRDDRDTPQGNTELYFAYVGCVR